MLMSMKVEVETHRKLTEAKPHGLSLRKFHDQIVAIGLTEYARRVRRKKPNADG